MQWKFTKTTPPQKKIQTGSAHLVRRSWIRLWFCDGNPRPFFEFQKVEKYVHILKQKEARQNRKMLDPRMSIF